MTLDPSDTALIRRALIAAADVIHPPTDAPPIEPPPIEPPPPIDPPPTTQQAVFCHLPWLTPDFSGGYTRWDWPQQIQERIDAGWATGAFLYSSGKFTFDDAWQNLVDAFPEGVDLYLSPKSIVGLREFLEQFPEVWRKRITFAYFQEPEDNHTTAAKRSEFRQKVVEAGEICRSVGVKNSVELSSWTLVGPAHGGEDALAEMIPPEAIDLIGWSLFRFQPADVINQIKVIAEYQNRVWPGVPWGGASIGISVPVNTPADSTLRADRAAAAKASCESLMEHGATHGSWYDVANPATPDRGDHRVDAQLLPVLQELKTSLAVTG